MKKLLTLIIMSAYFSVGALSVDSVINKTGETIKSGVHLVDTSSNFKMIYSDIKSGIAAMAASLKVTADQVFKILVMQQRVKAITWLALSIIGCIFVWIFIKRWKDSTEKWWSPDTRRSSYSNDAYPTFLGILRVGQLVIGVVMFIAALFHMDTITTGIINPYYGAIQDIMDLVKGK